jgi:hypothetical protein
VTVTVRPAPGAQCRARLGRPVPRAPRAPSAARASEPSAARPRLGRPAPSAARRATDDYGVRAKLITTACNVGAPAFRSANTACSNEGLLIRFGSVDDSQLLISVTRSKIVYLNDIQLLTTKRSSPKYSPIPHGRFETCCLTPCYASHLGACCPTGHGTGAPSRRHVGLNLERPCCSRGPCSDR